MSEPRGDESAERRELVESYRRLRSRASWALGVLVVAVIVAVTFREPERWDPSEPAGVARVAGWVVAALAVALALRWNGAMMECVGFCRGRWGKHPSALGVPR